MSTPASRVCVCVVVRARAHTHTQTGTQAHRQAHRHTDTQTHTDTHIRTPRQRVGGVPAAASICCACTCRTKYLQGKKFVTYELEVSRRWRTFEHQPDADYPLMSCVQEKRFTRQFFFSHRVLMPIAVCMCVCVCVCVCVYVCVCVRAHISYITHNNAVCTAYPHAFDLEASTRTCARGHTHTHTHRSGCRRG